MLDCRQYRSWHADRPRHCLSKTLTGGKNHEEKANLDPLRQGSHYDEKLSCLQTDRRRGKAAGEHQSDRQTHQKRLKDDPLTDLPVPRNIVSKIREQSKGGGSEKPEDQAPDQAGKDRNKGDRPGSQTVVKAVIQKDLVIIYK
jgi:hypothetical protein